MKRIICVLSLAVLAGAFLGNPAQAQQGGSMTKVGVVNIGTIFGKYDKVKQFRLAFEAELKPFKEEQEKLTKTGMEWEAALKSGKLNADDTARGQKTIIEIKRRLEDLKRNYQEKVAKRTEEQLVQLYKEVNEAIRTYASSQGYTLILAYGEPTEGDFFSFVNVTRKMQTLDQGGVIPIYFAGSLDISQPVLDNLNRTLQQTLGGGIAPRPPAPVVPTGLQK